MLQGGLSLYYYKINKTFNVPYPCTCRRSKEALSEEGGYHGSPDFSSSEQLKSSKSDSNYHLIVIILNKISYQISIQLSTQRLHSEF